MKELTVSHVLCRTINFIAWSQQRCYLFTARDQRLCSRSRSLFSEPFLTSCLWQKMLHLLSIHFIGAETEILLKVLYAFQNKIFSRCGSKTNGPRRGAWNNCLMACSQDSLEVNCRKSVKLSSWFSMLSSIRWFRLRRQIPGTPCRLLPARAWSHGLPGPPRPARAAPAKVIDESSPILTTMYNDIHIPNIWRGCLLPSASSLMSRLLRVLSHLRIYEIRFYLLMKTFMDYCPNCGWRDHT